MAGLLSLISAIGSLCLFHTGTQPAVPCPRSVTPPVAAGPQPDIHVAPEVRPQQPPPRGRDPHGDLGRVLAHWCGVTETPNWQRGSPLVLTPSPHAVLSRGPTTLVFQWPEAWLCPDPQSHANFVGGCEMASCLPLPAGWCSDAVVKQEACGAHVGM